MTLDDFIKRYRIVMAENVELKKALKKYREIVLDYKKMAEEDRLLIVEQQGYIRGYENALERKR